MRYAIVSDIHSNLQAWNAVLLDIRGTEADAIVSLGDLIGYGPNPLQVLESVYVNIDHFVLGNHDAVLCGKMDAARFNDKAQDMIFWTRAQLGREAVRFLKKLPLSLDGGSFRCAHGDFSEPAAFHYILEPRDALASWNTVREQLLFVGHTHCPAIFLLGSSGTPHVVLPQDFAVEEGKRYLVNVGSVGQPRNGDPRATYCIYDTEERTVVWRQVPFDILSYRKAVESAGLDPQTSCFLRHDPTTSVPPLRDMLTFSPARTPEEGVRNAVEVQEMNVLKHSRNRWRNLAIAIAVSSLLGAGIAASAWWRHQHRAQEIPGATAVPVSAVTAQPNANLLYPPTASTAPGTPIAGWTVRLGDKRRQTVHVDAAGGAASLVLSSGTARDQMTLTSPAIRVVPGMKLLCAGMFRKSDDFEGQIALIVSLTREIDGRTRTLDTFVVQEPNLQRAEGWLAAQNTKALPAHSATVRLRIRGDFTGTVEVRDVRLERR